MNLNVIDYWKMVIFDMELSFVNIFHQFGPPRIVSISFFRLEFDNPAEAYCWVKRLILGVGVHKIWNISKIPW